MNTIFIVLIDAGSPNFAPHIVAIYLNQKIECSQNPGGKYYVFYY